MTHDYTKPMSVTDVEIVFGGRTEELLPPMSEIPDEFKNYFYGTKWNKIISEWFFNGLPDGTDFAGKDGIDEKAALRHLKAIMGSFAPKHEHKEAGCAYLMSLWFERVDMPEKAQ